MIVVNVNPGQIQTEPAADADPATRLAIRRAPIGNPQVAQVERDAAGEAAEKAHLVVAAEGQLIHAGSLDEGPRWLD